ncbi:saccharopine dehydrogenase family protein [Nonomuraea sp. 10N515B]|uniref:saccharopine dehydrogenase family protein n=1 Tax=Nonomuraea sp. 10N515B TaxID=3457422 RepID=UPI003FCE4AEC
MRVLALGGAGGVGKHACRVAAGLEQVTELTVTDLDERRAERTAAALGPHVRGRLLDVTDTAALREALADTDVVINTVGPFFRFGVPILRAAIDAGCSYLDICDDWEPTAPMLKLNDLARSAGVTALVGMGASPGITNILAVLAGQQLDTVEKVITGWNLEAAAPEPTHNGKPGAAVVHGVQQITGTIRVTRDGRAVDERPLRSERLDYPGVGRRIARTFGHPEAITLARVYPGATTVNVAFAGPGVMAAVTAIGIAVDRGILSPLRAASVIERAERWLPSTFERALAPGRLPPVFALATGTRDNRPATVGCALAQLPGTTMGEVTGVPMGVALGLLPGAESGVHTPETLLDPRSFFAALAPHCLGAPDPDAMVVITRSWDSAPENTLHAAFAQARAAIANDPRYWP